MRLAGRRPDLGRGRGRGRRAIIFLKNTLYSYLDKYSSIIQVLGPLLAGLENISRRFINNLVWDLILVCIDAPGDWL